MIVKSETVSVVREAAQMEDAVRLVSALVAELFDRYGYHGSSPFHPDDVEEEGGAFFVARLDSQAVGCGAVRSLGSGVGEIKRVYVAPEARGKGIGRALMSALEQFSRDAGYNALVLETGSRQPESIGLYESLGYRQIPCFGSYEDDPHSVCFRKALVSAG